MHFYRLSGKGGTLAQAICAVLTTASLAISSPSLANASSSVQLSTSSLAFEDLLKPAYDCANDRTFVTKEATSRFLSQATFGAKFDDILQLTKSCASEWYIEQLTKSPSLLIPVVEQYSPDRESEEEPTFLYHYSPAIGFWRNAISGKDQLRQRVAFALSEILVVSTKGSETLEDHPQGISYYQDLLIKGAFGNYKTLLKDVTYSPAMAHYLTYFNNVKGDDETGRQPDENYARELLQLFTIGVEELNADGTPKLDSDGNAIETYSNADVQGLARVFTGFDFNWEVAEPNWLMGLRTPLVINADEHSEKEKAFLGHTIPAFTDGDDSVDQAIDHIFAHSNVGPFVGKQLIQRLVTSNPSRLYVARVARAFDSGNYVLPNGTKVGTGERGDLAATIAAILFDFEARNVQNQVQGKVREPVLRFTQWARAFNAQNIAPEYLWQLLEASKATALGQQAYQSPSVFNFFRPGYQAPGTKSGAQGLVAPELQITNATTIPSYINFMTFFIMGWQENEDVEALREEYEEFNIPLNADLAPWAFHVDYAEQIALADRPIALVKHLNMLLAGGRMSNTTMHRVASLIGHIPLESDSQPSEDDDDEEPRQPFDPLKHRVRMATLLVMTSADYLVQK